MIFRGGVIAADGMNDLSWTKSLALSSQNLAEVLLTRLPMPVAIDVSFLQLSRQFSAQWLRSLDTESLAKHDQLCHNEREPRSRKLFLLKSSFEQILDFVP